MSVHMQMGKWICGGANGLHMRKWAVPRVPPCTTLKVGWWGGGEAQLWRDRGLYRPTVPPILLFNLFFYKGGRAVEQTVLMDDRGGGPYKGMGVLWDGGTRGTPKQRKPLSMHLLLGVPRYTVLRPFTQTSIHLRKWTSSKRKRANGPPYAQTGFIYAYGRHMRKWTSKQRITIL